MKPSFQSMFGFVGLLWCGLPPAGDLFGQSAAPAAEAVAVIKEFRGNGVQVSSQPDVWKPARTNQALYAGNLLRTDTNSHALVQFSPLATARVAGHGSLSMRQPSGKKRGFDLLKGLLYFLHRDKPDEFEIRTPQMSAIIRGTEFTLEVNKEDGTSILSLIEGEASLSTSLGSPLELKSGEQGIAAPGQPLRKTALLESLNVIQWCLYYPAVLDPEELHLSEEERRALRRSLAAYQAGDLVAALEAYPQDRQPGSDAERVYLAAVRVAFGQLREAEELIEPISPQAASAPLAGALRRLRAAVRGPQESLNLEPLSPTVQSASVLLAESYRLQSLTNLLAARAAASQSVSLSPNFSFAWARVAELEFSFGRTRQASEAIEKALQLGPRNAQAHALLGFLLAARYRLTEALVAFDDAIAIDPALANGWLGRGLCRIKQGDAEGGRQDLQMAATVEPNRAILRSYLGKAFSNAGDDIHAAKELERAKTIDPKDPTSWLYSALFLQQQNRINEAISDLERSVELNENRRIYRSRLRLDEDLAVRGANLASIYRDAGMTEVSIREAAQAVIYDYANDSAHLFLSDSYNELRDPTRFNLRYETVWFNELLLANLLAPVGGGRLSQTVSQQEYSRLLESDGLGFANSTLARTDGVFTELASQFGTFGRTSYALDLNYEHHDGVRPNNDLDSIEWYTTIKQQVTPQDTAFLLVKYEDYHSGDNFQYYDPFNPNNHFRPDFRFDEYQHPIAVAGWHHEWSPGMHTLLLGGRLDNEQYFSDKSARQLLLIEDFGGNINDSTTLPRDVDYHNQIEIYTAELNQIFHWNPVTLTAGGRFQSGTFQARALLGDQSSGMVFKSASADDFERSTAYGYLTVEPLDHFWLTGGLAYDEISYPRNFRNPPIFSGQDHRSQLGPKAAVVWEPLPQATLRGVFTRSLGGVSLDESFRLEPTQLAGFPQAFRSLISESVVGSVAAPKDQTFGLALDLKFPSGTYAGIQAERLESNVRRDIGVFSTGLSGLNTDSIAEQLDYRENSLALSLNQLLCDRFVLGASYKFSQAQLYDFYPQVPVAALRRAVPDADRTVQAELHQTTGYVLFNDPSGFFARAEARWYYQRNSGYATSLPATDFLQENFFIGWRLAHRHVEILLGVLNMSGGDYHLNPLTTYAELPRKRVFEARLNFEF